MASVTVIARDSDTTNSTTNTTTNRDSQTTG
jgi:hypothetical protein